ncbi:hypothetical protein FRX31_012664 [Thalictrum thalictroides]|uniref:Uncharacterized protein n=1 Tax=Thalictrum thalictroides TaxID=46969 RepID=A0A7J6WMC2_THATH|nr:hypothetical protein FRX31_012664 [Thalictrum thalictroides]
MVKGRKFHNRILTILNGNNQSLSDENEIAEEIIRHFQGLMETNPPGDFLEGFDNFCNDQSLVNSDEASLFCLDIQFDESEGKDVAAGILNFFKSTRMLSGVNHTLLSGKTK